VDGSEHDIAAHPCGAVWVTGSSCIICRGTDSDEELGRVQVWEDEYWLLTMSLESETAGFSYLEPKRHIPYISDLDGEEAASFGTVLARASRTLRDETGSAVVYVYIFGDGVPHLHVHLAPHRPGDALNDQMIRGELVEEKLPNGFTRIVSTQFPSLPREELWDIASRVTSRLAASMKVP
jgi:diadenosine tetraphosphate (Ap4A) HIT family hydrolase